MLTPVEIQNKTFKSGGLGYDKKEVDLFLKEVVESYEAIYREKMELTDRVNTLNEGLQYYKTIEKTMQKALILAEKTAEETKSAALKNARLIEDEAKTKAQISLSDAKNELEHVRRRTLALAQQYDSYKAQFKNLAAAQIELLESESFRLKLQNAAPESPEAKEPRPDLFGKESPSGGKEEDEPLPEIDFSFVNASEQN